jgi:predicted secreted protein
MRAINLAAAFLLAATPVLAQEKKPVSEDVKKDVAAHRQIAQVHENAAKCLESGKPEKGCHDQLQKECKGVGIGKYCGMRHRH